MIGTPGGHRGELAHAWHHEIFSRFTFNREWDVYELSFAKFTAQVARKDPDIIGMPVYASQLFRFAGESQSGLQNRQGSAGGSASVPLVLTNVPELFARSSRRSRDHA